MIPTTGMETIGAEIQSRIPFLRELNDLKRLHSNNLGPLSYAAWSFREAATPFTNGGPLAAHERCAAIVSAARLGAITPIVLQQAGLSRLKQTEIFQRSIRTHSALPDRVRTDLEVACSSLDHVFKTGNEREGSESPRWDELLSMAPRAGATCPGKARIALAPVESHADHCLMVAVYGYILADFFGADREDAWVIGICHHLHNVFLPDAGFTGEVLLGDELDGVISAFRLQVLDSFSTQFRSRVHGMFDQIADDKTPLAKTFHAADTIDRVLQMEYYERAARFQVQHALEDMNLVHDGPAAKFQHALLKSVGLLPQAA